MSEKPWLIFTVMDGKHVATNEVPIDITTKEHAQELLDKYGLEVVRTMWENGAFKHPLLPEVKQYFAQRLIAGEL